MTSTSQRQNAQDIQRRLEAMIADGSLPAGDRLPAERELAAQLRANQRTIRRALDELVRQGVVVKRPRVGNFVRPAAGQTTGRCIMLVAPHFVGGLGRQDRRDDRDRQRRISAYSLLSMVMAGVNEVLPASRHPTSPLLYEPGRFHETCAELIARPDLAGVILWPDMQTSRESLKRLTAGGVSTVVVGHAPSLADLDMSRVYENTALHLQQAVDHLAGLGHRRIALLWYEASHRRPLVEPTWQALTQAHGLAYPDVINLPNHQGHHVDEQEVARHVAALFDDPAGPPTAVLTPDMTVTTLVAQACAARQMTIPQDVSLVLLGYQPGAMPQGVRYAAPDMVNLYYDIGQAAAQILQQRMSQPWTTHKEVALAAELDLSLSAAPPRQR